MRRGRGERHSTGVPEGVGVSNGEATAGGGHPPSAHLPGRRRLLLCWRGAMATERSSGRCWCCLRRRDDGRRRHGGRERHEIRGGRRRQAHLLQRVQRLLADADGVGPGAEGARWWRPSARRPTTGSTSRGPGRSATAATRRFRRRRESTTRPCSRGWTSWSPKPGGTASTSSSASQTTSTTSAASGSTCSGLGTPATASPPTTTSSTPPSSRTTTRTTSRRC